MIFTLCKIIKLGNTNNRLNNEIHCRSYVTYQPYITYTGVDHKERNQGIC